MAKLIPAVVLISVLLVLAADATSAYRTIITTVEIDDPTGRGDRSACRQEAQRRDFSACEQFMRRSRGSSREEDNDFLALEINPQDQQLNQCCSQLKQVRDDCQCEALKYVVEKQMGQRGRKESHKMRERAREIPSACGIQQCQMSFGFF